MSRYNVVRKPIPIPKVMNIPVTIIAMYQEWEKCRTTSLGRVQSDQRGAQLTARRSPCCTTNGLASSQELRVGKSSQCTQEEMVLRRDIVKDDRGTTLCLRNKLLQRPM